MYVYIYIYTYLYNIYIYIYTYMICVYTYIYIYIYTYIHISLSLYIYIERSYYIIIYYILYIFPVGACRASSGPGCTAGPSRLSFVFVYHLSMFVFICAIFISLHFLCYVSLIFFCARMCCRSFRIAGWDRGLQPYLEGTKGTLGKGTVQKIGVRYSLCFKPHCFRPFAKRPFAKRSFGPLRHIGSSIRISVSVSMCATHVVIITVTISRVSVSVSYWYWCWLRLWAFVSVHALVLISILILTHVSISICPVSGGFGNVRSCRLDHFQAFSRHLKKPNHVYHHT